MLLNDFLRNVKPPFTGEVLFDHFPDCVFFIKNEDGRYLAVNETLVQRCGFRDKDELLGRIASDVLPAPLGERFTQQDKEVVRTGVPLLSKLELHLSAKQKSIWCLTTKIPMKNGTGKTIGLAGMSRDLAIPDMETEAYQRVSIALEYAHKHLAAPIGVVDLARVAELSRYQLDRRMKLVFGFSTGQWLGKIRIDFAQQRLVDSDDAISKIALDSGYADQSAFSRQFRRATGLTPREFRKVRKTP